MPFASSSDGPGCGASQLGFRVAWPIVAAFRVPSFPWSVSLTCPYFVLSLEYLIRIVSEFGPRLAARLLISVS